MSYKHYTLFLFILFLAMAGSGPAPAAAQESYVAEPGYVRADSATSSSYTPDPICSLNPSGGAIRITRARVGADTVKFQNWTDTGGTVRADTRYAVTALGPPGSASPPIAAGLTCLEICELDRDECMAAHEVPARVCMMIFNACTNSCP